ncbi:hypothetical protein TNCV_1658441 [Trichonephila clavipes]|nr:hypothetical protein TNCV_1658441 [Trichonephila clavipes]
MENHLSKLKVQNIYDLESETSSERWRYERSLRLSSSFSKKLLAGKNSTPCSKLVVRIVYGRDLCNAAMKYGLANEEIARKQYERNIQLKKTPQEERSRNFEFSGFPRGNESVAVYWKKKIFKWHFWRKLKKQDLVLLAEELGQKVSDKMTNIELRNIIIGSKDYEEEFVRDQLSVILEERFERESEEKIARQLAIEEEKIARQHAIQQLRWESELNELRLEIESIRSNVKRTSCAEDRKKTSSNYRISIGRPRNM